MSSYKINKIYNNSESDRLQECAFNTDGSVMILGKTTIPDLGLGTRPLTNGSFEVFNIFYTEGKRFSSAQKIGETVTGLTDELLGTKVGITGNGKFVVASSAICIFRIYYFNLNTGLWEQVFAPPDSLTPLNIGGFKCSGDISNIISAHIGNMGQTDIFYYRNNNGHFETPAYALTSPFTDMFNAVRGLAISDNIDLSSGIGPIIAVLQEGSQPDQVTLNILELQETTYATRGSITKFDNTSSYKNVFVQISPNSQYLCVTSHNNYTLYVEFFEWKSDISDWSSVREFYFPRNTNDLISTYIYLSDFDPQNSLPYRFIISGINGLSQDSIYGVYGYDGITDKFIQLTNFSQKLQNLTNSSEPKFGFLEPSISRDLKIIWKSFLNTNGVSILPMNYDVYPEFDIPVDNINSTGIAGMIFTISDEGLVINNGHYTTPGPYVLNIPDNPKFKKYVSDNHLQVISYGIFEGNNDYEVDPNTGVVLISGGAYGQEGGINNHYNGIYVMTTTSPFWVDLVLTWKIPPNKPKPVTEPPLTRWQEINKRILDIVSWISEKTSISLFWVFFILILIGVITIIFLAVCNCLIFFYFILPFLKYFVHHLKIKYGRQAPRI